MLRGEEDSTLVRDVPGKRPHHLFDPESLDAARASGAVRRAPELERLRAR